MVNFEITATEAVVGLFTDLCSVKGSHITITAIDESLYIAAISPEFFKIVKLSTVPGLENFAIRLQKTMLKPMLSSACTLRFSIDSRVIISRVVDTKTLSVLAVPLEYDFNSELIRHTVSSGASVNCEYDISSLINLRPLLPFSDSGLQLKDNLAYVHGLDFIAYCKIVHGSNFIMTASNISELIKFIRSCGKMQIYESDVYIVFKHGGRYFGCKQPIRFIDSEYSSYLSLVPLAKVECSLSELHLILKTFTIPKGEDPKCVFNLQKNLATIKIGDTYHYDVSISNNQCNCKPFSLAVSVLKKIFSNTYLDYSRVTLFIYDSLISFRFNDIDILITRSDTWDI